MVGKYMIRPLLSLQHLSFEEQGGRVCYRYGKDTPSQEKMDYLEFIARVTSHIPDKGQVMIRYYGLYSNAHGGKRRKAMVNPSHPPIIDDEQPYTPSKGWAEMIKKVYEVDPLVCPEDQGEFIMDFWARPDPDPSTPEDEFRSQYYTRLAVADRAFRAGISGWMTDRGRIYILLDPPTDVIKRGVGDSSTEFDKGKRVLSSNLLEEGTLIERPTEIWVYNQYPDYFSGPLRLVFVDYESNGDYKLTTDVEVKPFSMMSYHQSDPDMIKYQLTG